jgi:Domain of unknown function (DUF4190)
MNIGDPPPAPAAPSTPAPRRVSRWAITSLILGLCTVLFFGVPGPFALVTGWVARRQIRGRPDLTGATQATIGLVLGALGTAFVVVVGLGSLSGG